MLRNGAQKLCEKGTFGFRRYTFVSSGRGALGFESGNFAQFAKKWGAWPPWLPGSYVPGQMYGKKN